MRLVTGLDAMEPLALVGLAKTRLQQFERSHFASLQAFLIKAKANKMLSHLSLARAHTDSDLDTHTQE